MLDLQQHTGDQRRPRGQKIEIGAAVEPVPPGSMQEVVYRMRGDEMRRLPGIRPDGFRPQAENVALLREAGYTLKRERPKEPQV